jgi:hypothetical protein
MRFVAIPMLLVLSAAVAGLTGCKRSLDEEDVRQFVDQADNAARKRYAPEICELRGEHFTLALSYQTIYEQAPPSEMTLNRKLYCREAGGFARLRQYRLERRSLEIDVADDARTANVVAEYTETRPYFEEGSMPSTPDDFRQFVIVDSHDESVVGIESGNLVFLSAKVEATEAELIDKSKLDLPYN